MADSAIELRRAAETLQRLERRLRLRADELSGLARRLRQVSTAPTFVAPIGDRSRSFVDAQARRLERLAARYEELARALRRLSGSLRPAPRPPTTLVLHADPPVQVDWHAVDGLLGDVVQCCPGVGPDWDHRTSDDEPGLVPVPGRRGVPPLPPWTPWWSVHREPRPVPRPGQTWMLDLGEIRTMSRQLLRIADRLADLGPACRREFDDPDGQMPARLRAGIERAGMSTARVCGDVADRLQRHARALGKRLATPGLLGPGAEYGLTSFGIDPSVVPLDTSTDAAFLALRADRGVWWDRARELELIMIWLCRRLPVVFGTPAADFFALAGLAEGAPPPDRPPGTLPPMVHPVPPGTMFTLDLVTDPATGIMMGRAEYYMRYGVHYGRPLPEPPVPVPAGPQESETSAPVPGSPAAAPEPEPGSDPRPDPASSSSSSTTTTTTTTESTVTVTTSSSDAEAAPDLLGAPAGVAADDAVSAAPDPDPYPSTDGSEASGPPSSEVYDEQPVDPEFGVVAATHAGEGSERVGESAAWQAPAPPADAGVPEEALGGGSGSGAGSSGDGYASVPGSSFAGTSPYDDGLIEQEAAGPAPVVAPQEAADPQLSADLDKAVRTGGVTVGRDAGLALGSVLVGGGTVSAAVLNRKAARKITSWARYKAFRQPAEEIAP